MSEACPECRGVARAKGRDSEKFRAHYDQEYIEWLIERINTHEKWVKTFYVCSGCNGKGTREAWAARVLSGDFDPNKPAQPQGSAIRDPAASLKITVA